MNNEGYLYINFWEREKGENFKRNNKEKLSAFKRRKKAQKFLRKYFFQKKGKNVWKSNKSIERNFH
jgi:hypothetical protein